jgi:serine/threonine protein phosphatase PrpC
MNCPVCGTDNREGAKFCRGCGVRLTEAGLSPTLKTESAAVVEKAAEGASPEVAAQGAPSGEEAVGTGSTEGASAARVPEAGQPEAAAGGEPALEEPVTEFAEEKASFGAAPEPAVAAGGEGALAGQGEGAVAAPEPLPPEQPEAEGGPEEDVLAFWRDEVEPMTPVAPETVIEGRYAVVEALDVQEHEILYHAQDLQRCWQCGYDANDPDSGFCARCGVLMDRHPDVRLLEVLDPEAEQPPDRTVLARLSDGSRHFLLLAEPRPEPAPEPEVLPEPKIIRFLVGQRSDPGQLRELDEDSLLMLTASPTYESRTGPALGFFVVADGMGGHTGGEVASKIALQILADHVIRTIILPELAGALALEDEVLALLRQATGAANDAVYLTRQKRGNDMGTTLSTVYIRNNRLFLAHVGDCRIYRWNADGLEQLTTDHSVIASMIADGQAKPEELYTHPQRSVVYRCIGDKPVVDVDTDLLPLAPGDRIILCCDGLWEMVRDEGIEDVMMQEADPQVACDVLVRRANAAGGEDNISVIVVQVEAMDYLED